jgi:hypothetical protein
VLSAEVVQNAERGRNDGGSLTPEKNGEAAGLLQTGAILKGTWHSVQGCAHAGGSCSQRDRGTSGACSVTTSS